MISLAVAVVWALASVFVASAIVAVVVLRSMGAGLARDPYRRADKIESQAFLPNFTESQCKLFLAQAERLRAQAREFADEEDAAFRQSRWEARGEARGKTI